MSTITALLWAATSPVVQSPPDFEALPDHPCVQPGNAGVYYETSAVEWSWSPDGEAIVYDRAIGEVSQLRARHLDSQMERCLTDGRFHDTQPNWSADDERIAFVRGRADAARIHVLRTSDGSVYSMSNQDRRSEYPAFSPDGSRLAYVRFGDEQLRSVVVRDLATDEERVLFDSPQGLNHLGWTPDGEAVSFYSIDSDGWNDVYEAQADGSGVRRLTDNTVTDTYSAAYAPDGGRLLYGQGSEVSSLHRWFNYDLYERDRTTGTVRRLTWASNADDRGYYSPDGRTIGFVSRRSGYAEIYLMDADGRNLRQITSQPEGELSTLIEAEGLEMGESRFQQVRSRDAAARPFGDRAAAVLTYRFLARGRPAGAIRVARMGVAAHPESWWTWTALGRALLAQGEYEAAGEALRESLRINPNQYQILFDLGFREFLRTLDSLDGIYTDRRANIRDLADWLHSRGELLTALTLLRRLDEAGPDDPSVLSRLAMLQMVLGDHQGAVATYRAVLELDPAHEDARFHLRRLRP